MLELSFSILTISGIILLILGVIKNYPIFAMVGAILFLGTGLLLQSEGIKYQAGITETVDGNVTTKIYDYDYHTTPINPGIHIISWILIICGAASLVMSFIILTRPDKGENVA